MLGRFGVRRLLALLVLVTGVAVAGNANSAGPQCAVPGQFSTGQDLWTKIDTPAFTRGGSQLTGYDVARNNRDHLLATNGERIAVTRDAGCVWTESAMPASSPFPSLPLQDGAKVLSESITQVRTSLYDPRGAWAIGQSTVLLPDGAHTRPRVLQSVDGGARFTDRSGAFPAAFGRPVAVHPLTAGIALLLFQQTAPKSTYEVFLTVDGGESWGLYFSDLPALSDLGVRATRDNKTQLLAWGSAGVYSAIIEDAPSFTDLTVYQTSATTMQELDGVGGGVVALTMAGEAFSAYLANVSRRLTSRDDGRTFRIEETPDGVNSASQGPLPGLVAISGIDINVWVEPPVHPDFRGISPTDFSPTDNNVSSPRFSADFSFKPGFKGVTFPLYAFSPTALFRRDIPADFTLPEIPPPPPAPVVDVDVHGVKPVRRVASLTPADAVVSLLPGQKKTIEYEIGLPPIPTPLDVFFMTDSTGSMSSTITSVQEGIQDVIDNLAASGIDARFGVADFRDYQQKAGPTDGTYNYPYKRRIPISKVGPALAEALASITAGGGTADHKDSALEATYQAVTGAGRVNPLPLQPNFIEPGQDAEFRNDAMKVVVVAADAEFRHPSLQDPTYPGPSLETVSQAMQDRGIHYVGIEVSTNPNETARPDMERLARETGTFAPATGIDCNNDGTIDATNDVSPLDPIVCLFAPDAGDSIAPTFIALLEGIRDDAAVDLGVSAERGVARPLAQTHFPKVNLRAPSDYRLPVEFSCNSAHVGTTTQVAISVRSRGAKVAGTTATVRCVPAEPPARQLPLALLPAVVPPPPPPPPAPVTNAQPNPNPNPNPNPQPNANAGAATNEEDQAQLATAESDQGPALEGNEEVAFSARQTESVPLPDVAWVGIVMLMSAAAFGTHLSRRNATWGQLRHQESR